MTGRAAVLTVASLLVAGLGDAATLVVANKSEATVSLVDLETGTVAATLPVGTGPHEVAISPDGESALIANYGTGPQPGSTLTLIDVGGAKVVRTIDLGDVKRPHGMVFLEGGRALVTSEAGKELVEVDVTAGKVLRRMPTGQELSHMVAVTPDRSRAFVANINSGSLTALDLREGKALSSVKTGAGTEGIDVTPDGAQVWVTNREGDTVTVVDARSLEIVATVPSAAFPIRVKVTPDGKHALVSNAKSGDVSVLSVAGRKVERRLALPVPPAPDRAGRLMAQFGDSSVPIGIVIAPGGAKAYVAHANSDSISILDLTKWERIGALTAGKEPDGMGWSKATVKKPAG